MKNFLRLAFIACLLLTGCSLKNSIDGLLRDGDNFDLFVDGQLVKKSPETPLYDRSQVSSLTTNWIAVSTGRICLSLNLKSASIGEFKKAQVIIKEYSPKKSNLDWRQFNPWPMPTSSTLRPGVTFCPDDFFVTERVRFKALPRGKYILSVRIYGTSDWDEKSTYLEVR